MITNDFIVSNSGINVSGRLQLGMLAADAQFSYYNHVRLTLNPPVTKIMTYMFCVAVYLKRQRIIMNYFVKKKLVENPLSNSILLCRIVHH